jgi:coenzyme F420-reducing hydrogenase gamma subunit
MAQKYKIGIFSLTGCEGCCFSILDLRQRFLELNKKVTIKTFRLFEESNLPDEKYDFAFVEGSPLTSANIANLTRIRANSKVLITIGSCAHIGGIYHMKQYQNKEKIFSRIYDNAGGIENFDVKTVGQVVPVDFAIPGCPINGEEFLKTVYQIIIGKNPQMPKRPVCYECQLRGYECLLQKGEICLGPITQGGCEAVCLKSKQGCWGCRGLVDDAEISNLLKKLREKYSDKEILKVFEVFGVKELIK